MENRTLDELPDVLRAVCLKSFEQKRFDDALLNSFAAYLLSRDIKNEESERIALVMIKGAAECLLPSKGQENQCSFCGRSPPEIRLAGGPDALICDSCVATLSEVFAETPEE
jgi:hypothetical protein